MVAITTAMALSLPLGDRLNRLRHLALTTPAILSADLLESIH
jgi:hypothetical protein